MPSYPPQPSSAPVYPPTTSSGSVYPPADAANLGMYPGLADYMGMELTESAIRENMPEYLPLALRPQVRQFNRFILSHKFSWTLFKRCETL